MNEIKSAPRDKTSMEVLLDGVKAQTDVIGDVIGRLSCMRERIYGPIPHNVLNETATLGQPGIANRANPGVANRANEELNALHDAVEMLHEQMNALEKYV